MVEICIFLEGAIVAHENDAAQTIDNSQRFRESFSRLFSTVFDENIKIIIDARGGFTRASRDFGNAQTLPIPLLLIDLDAPEAHRSTKLDSLCNEFNLTNRRADIYFMVQKMEAWILSQPEKIEIYFENYKKSADLIKHDNNLLNKDVKTIYHPDNVLNTILGRYFQKERKGRITRLKYGKLKDAPGLIEFLDFQQLRICFSDVENLFQRISNLT
jgi:hypothetical protein